MENLNALSDSEIIDYYYSSAVSEFEENWFENARYDEWYRHVANLPDKERVVYLISILDEEVFNGGFNQYFVNGYGQFAPETITAFRQINADVMSDLVQKAYNKVNYGSYDPSIFRKKLLAGQIEVLYNSDDLNDFLETLDDKYTEYPENISELLGNYLRL